MENFCDCRFCNIIAGQYKYPEIDKPFMDNEEFVAVTSIGALVEGWSLIIPRAHQLSMKNAYTNSRFTEFVNLVLPELIQRFGTMVAFEHGATKEGSSTACGTDHAHLHLVPQAESLLLSFITGGLHWSLCHSSEIASKTNGKEYLFYTDLDADINWQDPMGYLHILEQSQSQFFRRLIAEKTGKGDEFDYKRFPHIDEAQHTRMVLNNVAA